MKWYECLTVGIVVLGVLYFFYKTISLSGRNVAGLGSPDPNWTTYKETTLFDPPDESVQEDIKEVKKEIQKFKDEIKTLMDDIKMNKRK